MEIRNIFSGYNQQASIEDFSYKINPGEFILITGENGSGKTTILKTIAQIISPISGSIVSNQKISLLTSLNTSLDEFYPITGLDMVKLARDKRTKFFQPNQALDIVEAKDFSNKVFSKLSTGQKQRIRIAVSIVNNPSILCCDEPLTGLDAMSKKFVISSLNNWVKSTKNTLIIVEHNTEEITPFVTSLWKVSNKKIHIENIQK